MTDSARIAFGTEFWFGPSGGTLVKVPELVSLSPPSRDRELIDVTSHDSAGGVKEYCPAGTIDPGELSGEMYYIAQSAIDLAFLAAINSNPPTLLDCRIVLRSAGTALASQTFQGFLTNYAIQDLGVEDKQMVSFTVKVTGPIVQAAVV